MKSIDISAARACGMADTANASMLNAKRIFFIIVNNVSEAFDFSAPGFIQLLIRKLNRSCAFPVTMNGHECTLIFSADSWLMVGLDRRAGRHPLGSSSTVQRYNDSRLQHRRHGNRTERNPLRLISNLLKSIPAA